MSLFALVNPLAAHRTLWTPLSAHQCQARLEHRTRAWRLELWSSGQNMPIEQPPIAGRLTNDGFTIWWDRYGLYGVVRGVPSPAADGTFAQYPHGTLVHVDLGLSPIQTGWLVVMLLFVVWISGGTTAAIQAEIIVLFGGIMCLVWVSLRLMVVAAHRSMLAFLCDVLEAQATTHGQAPDPPESTRTHGAPRAGV